MIFRLVVVVFVVSRAPTHDRVQSVTVAYCCQLSLHLLIFLWPVLLLVVFLTVEGQRRAKGKPLLTPADRTRRSKNSRTSFSICCCFIIDVMMSGSIAFPSTRLAHNYITTSRRRLFSFGKFPLASFWRTMRPCLMISFPMFFVLFLFHVKLLYYSDIIKVGHGSCLIKLNPDL